MSKTLTRLSTLTASGLAIALLTGCSPIEQPKAEETVAEIQEAVTVNNCDRDLVFETTPERVVSLWQPANETLLALGVRDKIVAMAGNYTALRPDLAALAEGIPSIGTGMAWPAKETLLTQNPDLVVSELIEGFAFDESQGYATVAQIQETGANVYATSACNFTESFGKTVDTVYADLENLGKIFRVEDRAAELIADLKARKQAVQDAVADKPVLRVAFYNGGEGPLYVLSGGIWGDAISIAGGETVFPADVFQVSVEEFAASDAEVILVGTYDGQDFATLKSFIESKFPDLQAVKDGRIYEVPTIETEASVRVMDGVERIASVLHPDAGIQVRKY